MIDADGPIGKRLRHSAGAVLLCVLIVSLPPLAGDEARGEPVHNTWTWPATLPATADGTVTAVLDSAGLRVAGIAADVRLADTLMGSDLQALKQLVDGHEVSLRAVRTDRRGRLVAQVVRDDGLWIQAAVVEQGLARVTPHDADAVTAELLNRETAARKNRLGLWADPGFAVRSAADLRRLHGDVGTFQIVAGYVVETARRGDVIYLNFGKDFRSDFTVTIPRDSWPRFAAAGMKPLQLTGRVVQVRGWIVRGNGPALQLTDPAGLQILEDAGKGAAVESVHGRHL